MNTIFKGFGWALLFSLIPMFLLINYPYVLDITLAQQQLYGAAIGYICGSLGLLMAIKD